MKAPLMIQVPVTNELREALTEVISHAYARNESFAVGSPMFELLALLSQVQIAQVLQERAA